MSRFAIFLLLALGAGRALRAEEPEGLLDRFLSRMNLELGRLPDYVCTQTIERFSRNSTEQTWQKADSLRFEVAMIANRELYALPGGRFQDRPLATMIGRGTTGTGQFGLLAKHVFLTSTAAFKYEDVSERDGRTLHEYHFDVEARRSSYKLRRGTAESPVAFQGAFWIDVGTLDLVRLEVQAYDIPEMLGLAEAETAIDYARMTIDREDVVLPVVATLKVTGVDGNEDMNRTRLAACRHYRADSSLSFQQTSATPLSQTAAPEPAAIPPGSLVELALEDHLDPALAKVGDALTAKVTKSVRSGEQNLIIEGALARGRIARLETQRQPFLVHLIALEFDTIQIGGHQLHFNATMQDAGPAAGLIRQAKRLDPKFSRWPTGKMDVLVREIQKGQGILLWDGKHGPVPRGLRMKWRVNGEATQ
jgi:hypothetical protein